MRNNAHLNPAVVFISQVIQERALSRGKFNPPAIKEEQVSSKPFKFLEGSQSAEEPPELVYASSSLKLHYPQVKCSQGAVLLEHKLCEIVDPDSAIV